MAGTCLNLMLISGLNFLNQMALLQFISIQFVLVLKGG
ncbi:hypothetical protein SALWKB29_1394 [Snodgrassella communis]|uniref:Uncharacterized protein n=1 Tax=Snodgrassella communis TaxID=2946699 RepID=A0A836Z5P9_9NEIS|nr:hypothetical protein SALWKB29_1394 [Snodgrassella communis]